MDYRYTSGEEVTYLCLCYWLIIVQQPGILLDLLLAVGKLLHLVDHDQSLRIDLGSRNVGVCGLEEAPGDPRGPLHVVVSEGAVADPVVGQALGALPVRWRLGSLRERALALVLCPVLLRVHLRGVAHHLGQLVLLRVPGAPGRVEARDAGEASGPGAPHHDVMALRPRGWLLLPDLLKVEYLAGNSKEKYAFGAENSYYHILFEPL